MYVLLYGYPSKKEYPDIPSSCSLLIHSEFGQMLEDLRSVICSEPCILLSYRPLSDIILSHLQFCYPELIYLPYGTDIAPTIKSLCSEMVVLNPKTTIRTSHIVYAEKKQRAIHFHYSDYYRVVPGSMHKLPDMQSHGILRCHYSYLVNLKEIRSLQDNDCILNSGRILPVSRAYRPGINKYRKMQQSISRYKINLNLQKDTRHRN